MGFWLRSKRQPQPPPSISSTARHGRRSSKQRSIKARDDEEDLHDEERQQQQRQPRRFLFPWQRRQLAQQKSRALPKSWSRSESEELSPDNSADYDKQNGGVDRRPFLRNAQRQRNSQEFDEEEEGEDDYDANDQVHDPRYRLEPPMKGSASMTSYAAASADVSKTFTLSTSSQSTSETIQLQGRNSHQQQQQQQQTRSKLYMPMDSHGAGNEEAYQTRIIHPNIHKRDIFIDTSRTPDGYQQQQHRNSQNNNTVVVKQQTSYHNARPDPDTILDILGETTTRHTNIVKRPDPIEDMTFPTPKSHYSPSSFTSPRTTTSFNLPSYSVTGSMLYNAREQYGMESRAVQPVRASNRSPFKPTTVPSNSILASMLFRTTQLDDQPQSEQPQQVTKGSHHQVTKGSHHHHHHHHQRLPPSYGATARKEEEQVQSEASSPGSEVDENYDYEEEEEDEEEVEVTHVETSYRLEPDGMMNSGRGLNNYDQRPQARAYQEPEAEFDPRQYYYQTEDFMNVPDDIIRPQGSGISSVSSVTDMWASVVDNHWNHANSRMIDLLENAMAEKFPTSKQATKRPAAPHQNQGRPSNQYRQSKHNNSSNNKKKNGILYEA